MRAALLAIAAVLLAAAPAAAAPTLVKIGDFSEPVHVASPPNDPRLFVVEKRGTVKIAGIGTFLDVSSRTETGYERGLLSIAFPPDYATSGLFYVFLTAKATGNLTVLEFARSSDANRADPTPRRQFLSIPHPNPNPYHNGGQLQFGPDGMLYVGTGEGHDSGNAQNLSSPLGKILRLDPRTGGAAAGNPHGLVWSYGLRNPWRFTFDRLTGDMIIGDVGAGSWEEIDWAPAPTRGRDLNFGWPDCEGPDPMHTCGEHPVIAHDHSGADGFLAIVGGYVVRDPGVPSLNGRYLYGDNDNDALWSAVPRTGAGVRAESLAVANLSSFGEDACGRIYAASLSGPVYRIQDGAPTPCNPPPPPGGGGPGAVADRRPPGVTVSLGGVRDAVKRRRLKLTVNCDEPCRVRIGTRLRRVKRLATRRRDLAANTRAVIKVPMSRATARRLRRALARRRFVRVAVTVRVSDAAGNVTTKTRRGRIRRR